MNTILSITVYATVEHGTLAKICAKTCSKICMNGQNLGLNIINV